jgi:uncharacterized protein (TIGR02246 family)
MATTVRELIDQSAEAVRRRDMSAVARLYHPNAALHTPGSDLVVGRSAIVEHLSRLLENEPRGLVHDVEEEHLHEVTPDLAIVDTVGVSRWGDDQSGVEGFTMIAVRDPSGQWLWAGVRGTLVPN